MIAIAHALSAAMLTGTLHAPVPMEAPAPLDVPAVGDVVGGPTGTAGRTPGHLGLGYYGADGSGRGHEAALSCDPDGGAHPAPAAACAALDRAGGDFTQIAGRNGMCPMIYKPVTAIALGDWGGNRVRFKQTYANLCVLRNELAPVYDF